ncbi:MAG: MoaD/ThiS family protein, partial [Terriglobales bacterium]
ISAHPQLQGHLYTSEGRLRSFVNIYLNDEDIRYTGLENTPVRSSDTVSIIPSIAGGSASAARC